MAKEKFFRPVRPLDEISANDPGNGYNKILRSLQDLTGEGDTPGKHYSKLRLVRLDEVIGRFNNISPLDRDRDATQRNYQHDTESFSDSARQIENLCDPFELVYDDDEYLLVFYSEQSSKFYPINGRTVRHAITCRDSSNRYPSRSDQPDTYPIRFVKLVYAEAGGRQGHVLSYLTEDNDETDFDGEDRFVHNIVDPDLFDAYIPEGSLIEVYNVTRQWFTHVCCGADDSSESESASSLSSSSESSSSSSSQSSSSLSSSSSSSQSESESSSSSSSSSVSESSLSSSESSLSSRGSSLSSSESSGGSSGSSAGESSISESQSSGYVCVTVISGDTPPTLDVGPPCTITWCVRTICFPAELGVEIGEELC